MFLIDLWLKKYFLFLEKQINSFFLMFFATFLFVIIVTPANAVVFTQLGSDIVANAANDELGTSVSISGDGRRIAVGAPVNDGSGGRTGYVRVYEYSGGSWIQLGNDIDVEMPDDYDGPGCTVSISADGRRIAVGAYMTYGSYARSGDVRIYEYDGSSWIQLGGKIYGEAAYDASGTSVSLSADGNRVAIGAPYNNNEDGISSTGHVRIHEYNGSDWIQLGNDIDGDAHKDQSGASVSISADGSRVAIGAPYNDGNGTDSGHVRIYEYNGIDWIQLGLDIDGEGSDDRSGASVSISADGSRVAVGAPYNYSTGYGSDHVRIYEYVESAESWIKLGSDINAEVDKEGLGTSVSLSTDGSRIAVGAPGNDGGHVRIYEYSDKDKNWIKIGSDIDAKTAYDGLGTSVSLSTDGLRVVIGAPYYSDGNRTFSGHARIYDLSYPCGNTVTALTEYKWWSVSRPCGISTDPTIKDLFSNPDGSGLGIYGDNNDWVMWKLDGTNPDGTEKYTMMDSSEVMKSGVGYWIITSTPGVNWNPGAIAETLDPTGAYWNVATIGTVGQTSLNGINAPDVKEFLVVDPITDGGLTLVQDTQLALIGNPFPKKITWSNVYFSNNGTDYTAIDSIPSGVKPIAYVSDPDSTSGQPYKAVSSAPGFTHTIEQNQAFWIQMTGTVERHTLKRIALPLEY